MAFNDDYLYELDLHLREKAIKKFSHIKIDDLNLSARSFNSLDRAGLKYLGELVLMSEVEVKNIKNLGTKSYNEIAEKLESLGYRVENTLPENIASSLRRKLEQLKA